MVFSEKRPLARKVIARAECKQTASERRPHTTPPLVDARHVVLAWSAWRMAPLITDATPKTGRGIAFAMARVRLGRFAKLEWTNKIRYHRAASEYAILSGGTDTALKYRDC